MSGFLRDRMSEEKDLFTPTRLQILRETWQLLRDSKDLAEAQTRFKQLILSAVLGEDLVA